MKSLKKIWVRVVLSLLMGGFLQETIHVITGKDNSGLLFLGAVISFIVLSVLVYVYQIIYYSREIRNESLKKEKKDIIDN